MLQRVLTSCRCCRVPSGAMQGLAEPSQHGEFAQQVPQAVPSVQGSPGHCSRVVTAPLCWWLRGQRQQEAQPLLQLPPRCQVMQRPLNWSLSLWPTRALHQSGARRRHPCQLSPRCLQPVSAQAAALRLLHLGMCGMERLSMRHLRLCCMVVQVWRHLQPFLVAAAGFVPRLMTAARCPHSAQLHKS